VDSYWFIFAGDFPWLLETEAYDRPPSGGFVERPGGACESQNTLG
jgi:hypothetical protein